MKRNSLALCCSGLAAIFALAISPLVVSAQTRATGPHTTITLLADHPSLTHGGRTRLGLRFQMEKGWHIYWTNPGDSGEPPKIQWQLPAGFHLGPMEWPAPERLTAPSIVDYGYENQAVLIVPLRVPTNLKNGEHETIAANVNWLVCREICIPAKGRVSLTLPAGSPADNASSFRRLMLARAEADMPKRPPATWKLFASTQNNDFVLTVETGKPERVATFFPLEAEQIKNDAPQVVTPFSRGVRLKLQKSDGLLKPIAQLRGVLELGTGRAYEIAAPVHAMAKGTR